MCASAQGMQSLYPHAPKHHVLAVSCCLVDVLCELLRNYLGTMILQSCHPWPRYTFQPITRNPTSFNPQLEPASKLCSRSRSSLLVPCHGLQCFFSYTQGFILMSLVEITLFPVCHQSDMLPSFTPEMLAPSRCSV